MTTQETLDQAWKRFRATVTHIHKKMMELLRNKAETETAEKLREIKKHLP